MAHCELNRRLLLGGLLAACATTAARGASAQADLSRSSLTGVWRGHIEQAGISIDGELIFRRGGTYQRMHQLGQLMTWASGSYQIAENWIHFEVEDYEPKYYQGVFQHPPPSETWMVDYFDGERIEGQIGDSARFGYRKTD